MSTTTRPLADMSLEDIAASAGSSLLTRKFLTENLCTIYADGAYISTYRYSMYIDWFNTLLVAILLTRDGAARKAIRRTTQLHLLSIAVGVYWQYFQRRNLIDAIIFFWLAVGSLSSQPFIGIGSNDLGYLCSLLLVHCYIVVFGYNFWLRYAGIIPRADLRCYMLGRPHFAYFGKTILHDWNHYAGLFLSATALAISLYFCWRSVSAVRETKEDVPTQHSPLAKYAELDKKKKNDQDGPQRVELGTLLLSIGLIGISIVTIEYLLHINKIHDPPNYNFYVRVWELGYFAMSCYNSCMICWKVVNGKVWHEQRQWTLFGRLLSA